MNKLFLLLACAITQTIMHGAQIYTHHTGDKKMTLIASGNPEEDGGHYAYSRHSSDFSTEKIGKDWYHYESAHRIVERSTKTYYCLGCWIFTCAFCCPCKCPCPPKETVNIRYYASKGNRVNDLFGEPLSSDEAKKLYEELRAAWDEIAKKRLDRKTTPIQQKSFDDLLEEKS